MKVLLRAALAAVLAVPALAGAPAFEKNTYTYKTVGDCAIQADVYRLPGSDIRPAIFWIHGGALIMGHRTNINHEQLERYLKAGFAVVSIDYRLAPETKLPEILTDVRDAWAWLRETAPTLRIDPDRIGVVGHSAGGYLTLTCGHRLKPRPRALVAFYGYGDIVGEWYSRPDPFYSKQPLVSKEDAWASVGKRAISGTPGRNDRDRFYLYCRQRGLWPDLVAGIDPRANPRAFDEFCPLRNVSREYPPTMLLHGDRDTDVPLEQSAMMEKELARQGVEREFVKMSGGEHGFDRQMDSAPVSAAFDRAVAFLTRHLGR